MSREEGGRNSEEKYANEAVPKCQILEQALTWTSKYHRTDYFQKLPYK